MSTHLHADGRYKDLLLYPDGVSSGFQLVREGNAGVRMKGNEVYKVAVNTLGALVTETLAANKITKDQIDWLIPHQANIRIIEAIARRLELPMERVIVTINTHGNTSAASVPLALDTGIRDGRIKRGHADLLVIAQDHAAARAAQGLVRRRGDDMGVRQRARMDAARDQPGEMRHVDHQKAPTSSAIWRKRAKSMMRG